MLELTAKIILIGSIFGMGYIIIRKIPAITVLTENRMRVQEKKKSFPKKKIFPKLKNFKKKKSFKEKKSHLSDDYWKKIRKG